jgi:DNA-binding CsgD family transcriptional regulator
MNHAILALNLGAFISGAAAMAFLLALGRQRPGKLVSILQGVLFCLTFIALCNGIDFYLRAFAGIHDPRIPFLTMNMLCLAMFAAIALQFRAVEVVTGKALGNAFWAFFRAQSFLVYLACLLFSLFAERGIDGARGYLISALDAAMLLAVAGTVILARHRLIAPENRRYVLALVAFAFAWLIVDVGNELFLWQKMLPLPHVSMSPFFLLIMSGCSIARVLRLLGNGSSLSDAAPCGIASDPLGMAVSPGSPPRVIARWDLSSREKSVLDLLVSGLENADIAEQLFISPHTVKNHVSNIYRKAGVKNRLELIRMLGSSGRESSPGN